MTGRSPPAQVEAFQRFLDGPAGPGEEVFSSTVHKAVADACCVLPASGFDDTPAEEEPPLQPAGGFFWVEQAFVPGRAVGWWEGRAELAADRAAEAEKLGFWNHSFVPAAAAAAAAERQDGAFPPGWSSTVACVWESKVAAPLLCSMHMIDQPAHRATCCHACRCRGLHDSSKWPLDRIVDRPT